MANTNTVPKFYRTVVDDVINNAREMFLDDGVDEQVLQELKQLWESKLQQSKAVEGMSGEQDQVIDAYSQHQVALQQKQQLRVQPQAHTPQVQPTQLQQVRPVAGQAQPRLATIGHATPTTTLLTQPKGAYNMVQNMAGMARPPTLPLRSVAPSNAAAPAHINVAPPSHPGHPAHQNHRAQLPAATAPTTQPIYQSQTIGGLSSAAQAAALALPTSLYQQQFFQPGTIIQGQDGTQYIIQAQPQVVTQQGTPANYTVQMPGITSAQLVEAQAQAQAQALVQIDGTNDSSSDDDDEFDDKDDDDDDENEGNDENDEFAGEEEEPLNSEDDVSDEDPVELFDSDNVVVCQFDKITRCKNRWKFQLKDGIMNLKGKDYVFHRAVGESEW